MLKLYCVGSWHPLSLTAWNPPSPDTINRLHPLTKQLRQLFNYLLDNEMKLHSSSSSNISVPVIRLEDKRPIILFRGLCSPNLKA